MTGTCTVLQAIALLDTLDKDVNTFIMRVREWYGWHFPELAKVVPDNFQYAKIVMLAKDKSNISDDMIDDLKEIVEDEDVAEQARSPAAQLVSDSKAVSSSRHTLQTVCNSTLALHSSCLLFERAACACRQITLLRRACANGGRCMQVDVAACK